MPNAEKEKRAQGKIFLPWPSTTTEQEATGADVAHYGLDSQADMVARFFWMKCAHFP